MKLKTVLLEKDENRMFEESLPDDYDDFEIAFFVTEILFDFSNG
jgi:hypothetical protein